MNFVAQLEDYLRDLGSEARKKHPGVKEASERAILKLRTLQNAYVSAVRKASSTGTGHPDTKIFRSSDLLHPFLLAANYPNASPKLLDTSFRAMKTLMEANAICPGDGRNMVRVWMIQAQVVVSYSSVSTPSLSKDKGSSVATTSSIGGSSVSPVPSNVKSIGSTDQSSSKSSSWFGGLLSSSSSTTSSSSVTTYSVTNNNTAVSSSHGKGASHLTAKDLEKLGLDILSCLLQLLELRDLPVSPEQWTQSVTLCCLLYLPGLPTPVKRAAGGVLIPLYQHSTVRQAAHSTLPQVLSLLLSLTSSSSSSPDSSTAEAVDDDENQATITTNDEAGGPTQEQQRTLAITTWNDIVTCIMAGVTDPLSLQEKNIFQGAFSQCRLAGHDAPSIVKDIAQPPSVALSLELLTTLLKEEQRSATMLEEGGGQQENFSLFDEVASKTFTVVDQVLHALGGSGSSTTSPSQNPLEFVRLLQLVLILLQTKSSKWPVECRNLVSRLIRPIPTATASLRRHADFEDGHIFQRPSSVTASLGTASAPGTSSSSSSNNGLAAGAKSGSDPIPVTTAGSTFDTLRGLPPTVLWKACLCIELLQQIVQDPSMLEIWKHADALVPLFESMSDFCTIGASCQDHMALVVVAAQRMPSSSTSVPPPPGMMTSPKATDGSKNGGATAGLFHVAETLAASSGITTSNSFHGNLYDYSGGTTSSSSNKNNNTSSSPSYYPLLEWWRLGQGRENHFILGDALWIGLNSVLTMIDSLDPEVLEQVFAPCLAVLQHYLKRFPASGAIVQRSLTGYYKLSKIAIRSDPLLRRALLSSLCKLAMPTPIPRVASFDEDSSPVNSNSSTQGCLLRDHNVAALICLINLVHRQFNSIGSEWTIVLQTFQELSILPISSPDLSDVAYVDALSISAVYGRLSAFSTCLSDESLFNFAQGLAELAPVVEMQQQPYLVFQQQQLQQQSSSKGDRATVTANKDGANNPSIGAKLVNIGVRAIYGSQDGSSSDDDVPLAERTRNTYAHDFQKEFRRRMARSKHPIRGIDGTVGSSNAPTSVSNTRPQQEAPLPFALELLADVAMSNSFRISRCNVSRQLCSWAAETESTSARLFAMDAVAMLILSHISVQDGDGNEETPEGFPATFIGPGKIIYRNPRRNQYLAAEKLPKEEEEEGTTPAGVHHLDLLRPLCECIQTVKVATVAEAGLETLHTVLESAGHKLSGGDVWAVVIDAVASLSSPERSHSDWAPSCMLGFRCLKLIVDDFLDLALVDGSVSSRTSLLNCCFAFGCSRHDVNTSLTAIGLLWTIADQDPGGESASVDDPVQLALSKLVLLSSDNRAEVRNCAVNTLVSCVVGRGQGFSPSQWQTCICDMIFGVYEMVSAKGAGEENTDVSSKPSSPQSGRKRYKVNIHHSRDSADKQWVATQSLVLRSLCRILRAFFSVLLDTTSHDDPSIRGSDSDDTPWFDDAWNRVLGYAFDAATQVGGRDTLELRSAGVELLVLCNQLACRAGIQAALSPARVGTNMEVVNGALRSVRSPAATRKKLARQTTSSVSELWRENLFLDAFDVLDSFREHLESDAAVDHESGLSPFLEPTQVQVLSKFAENLSKLYDCCKDDEFLEGLPSCTLPFEQYLGLTSGDPVDVDSLVFRFVRIIVTVVEKSSGGPEQRFLSQAERSCVDLLRSMASNGSAEAFMNLTKIAGLAFFSLEKTPQANMKYGIDAQSHEAAKIVREEVTNVGVPKECKIVVGCRILSDYLDEEGEKEPFSLQLAAPIFIDAMKAASVTTSTTQGDSQDEEGSVLDKLVNALWLKVTDFLSRSTKPSQAIQSDNLTIRHVTELLNIVQAAAVYVPPSHHETICAVLSLAASSCLRVAKEIDKALINAKDLPKQEQQVTSENELELFAACFVGACSVRPTDQHILTIAEDILAETYEALKGGDVHSRAHELGVRPTLLICRAMQEIDGIEPFLVAVFPGLCKLIGTEHTALRMAVGKIISRINVGEALEESKTRCQEAEDRAVVAEARAIALEVELAALKSQKEDLERQVVILTATAAM